MRAAALASAAALCVDNARTRFFALGGCERLCLRRTAVGATGYAVLGVAINEFDLKGADAFARTYLMLITHRAMCVYQQLTYESPNFVHFLPNDPISALPSIMICTIFVRELLHRKRQ